MAVLIRPKRSRLPKRANGRIDYSDPLAQQMLTCFLLDEGAGSPRDLKPPATTALDATPTWAPTAVGVGMSTSGGSGVHSTDTTYNLAAQDFTVRVLHRPNSWAGFSVVFEKARTSAGSTADRELSVFCSSTAVSFLSIGGAAGLNNPFTVSQPLGVVSDLVLTRRGTTVSCYLNGVLQGTATSTATAAVSGTSVYLGKNISGGGTSYDGVFLSAQTWSRALTPGEIQRLAIEPYAFVQQAPRHLLYLAPTTVSYSVTVTASLSASPSLARVVALAVTSTALTTGATAKRAAGLGVAATLTAAATLKRAAGVGISTILTTAASVKRAVGMSVAAVCSSTAGLARAAGVNVSATLTAATSLIRSTALSLLVVTTTTASLVRAVSLRLVAAATVTASASRGIALKLATTLSTTATLVVSLRGPAIKAVLHAFDRLGRMFGARDTAVRNVTASDTSTKIVGTDE